VNHHAKYAWKGSGDIYLDCTEKRNGLKSDLSGEGCGKRRIEIRGNGEKDRDQIVRSELISGQDFQQ
jgi:hypothetical protein